MALSNRDRVGRALETLNAGIMPFFEREMKTAFGAKWMEVAQQRPGDTRHQQYQKDVPHWDTQAILSAMIDNWKEVFGRILGHAERSLVGEIKDIRNRWAHQEAFSLDDAYRTVDSIGRLLIAVGSAAEAADMERQKDEVLRFKFEQGRGKEATKAAVAPVEGTPMATLKPWREVMMPHPDVASGRFQQAEFAADLGRVDRGEGTDEYRDPHEFYSRTHMTAGLKELLVSAIRRINGEGGDPVIELQTSFGGGKTHSLLALYHAFSGVDVVNLPGLEGIVHDLGGLTPRKVQRAVIVGTALNAAEPRKKDDGTVVHTLWGELAWRLLKKEGYKLVKEADVKGTSPGSDVLRELFAKAGPCLILMDELVVFIRLLYQDKELPAGSFDDNLSFMQSLTEAAQAMDNVLVVVSLPASDTPSGSTAEVGGEAGRETLARLQSICYRVAKPWRPASAEESFEIVRRRLFQDITDNTLFSARDAVCRAFVTHYKNQKAEFPAGCGELEFERRIKSAYPIHPELFDRLFTDWSTLDKFQRTRGVLRLMASVISTLWQRNDGGLLIMPASVPIDDPDVNSQLVRYLEDPWGPVIDKDVDGINSLPVQLDKANTNYGKYSACRRVARTVFLGSAATAGSANRGLDLLSIKLGCFQPGETVAVFTDALRKLADNATYLYPEGTRYWYSVQPSVNRLAHDRANQADKYAVQDEILRRLRAGSKRGEFVSVHVAPDSSDVPDELGTKLVILGPDKPHAGKDPESPARKAADEILRMRGNAQRHNANTLVFAAADRPRLNDLDSAVRRYLAWKSIHEQSTELELTPSQEKQAENKVKDYDRTVDLRIQETFTWLLVPGQPCGEGGSPAVDVEWEDAHPAGGNDPLPVRAWRKLEGAQSVAPTYGGSLLRHDLDSVPLWRGNHVSVKQLVEDYGKYLYLQRVRDPKVILESIADGVATTSLGKDGFAYADSYDEEADRYTNLKLCEHIVPAMAGCVVKADVALAQRQTENASAAAVAIGAASLRTSGKESGTVTGSDSASEKDGREAATGRSGSVSSVAEAAADPTRFYGTVTVDATRLAREFGRISEEVISHLAGLGSKVELNIEITARNKKGFPPQVVRTVLENCRTLKFTGSDFEQE